MWQPRMLLEVNMQGSRGSRGFGVIALGRAVRERAASIESPTAVGELAGGERQLFLLQPSETRNAGKSDISLKFSSPS